MKATCKMCDGCKTVQEMTLHFSRADLHSLWLELEDRLEHAREGRFPVLQGIKRQIDGSLFRRSKT